MDAAQSETPMPNFAFSEVTRKQQKNGIQIITESLSQLRKKENMQTDELLQADSLLEQIYADPRLGKKSSALLDSGLSKIGLAEYMDDDDYQPLEINPAMEAITDQLVSVGVDIIIQAEGRAVKTEDGEKLSKEKIEAILLDEEKFGQRGRDTIRKGLKDIGLSVFIDDE